MPIAGYDLDDLDDVLEGLLGETEKADVLTESDWLAYRGGDERLVYILDRSEIERLLEDRDVPDEPTG